MTCIARFGWSFTDYSLLVGQQYRFGERSLWGLTLQYDKFRRTCVQRTNYYGIGLSYHFNENYTELGLKGMWNPTHLTILISPSAKLYPYLYGQGNLIRIKSTHLSSPEPQVDYRYSLRPGLGLTGSFREDKAIPIRSYFQIAYAIPIEHTPNFKNALTVELKLGIGINTRELKTNNRKKSS